MCLLCAWLSDPASGNFVLTASEESGNSKRVNKQHDQRSDERHEEARRVAFLVHAGHSADEASQPRTDQAQNHRHYQAHMLAAWHHGTSQKTNKQSEDGVPDHV